MRTRHRTRGRVAAIAALAVAVLLLGGGWALYTRNDDASAAQAAAKRYLGTWSRGSDSAAARLTDQPREAAASLTASRRGLDGARVHAALKGDVDEQDGRATAPVAVAWRVPGIGAFAYRTTLRLSKRGDRWVVRWSPRAIHPRLGAGTRLGTSPDAPARGRILARDGRAIVKPRAVVDAADPRVVHRRARRPRRRRDGRGGPLWRYRRRADRGPLPQRALISSSASRSPSRRSCCAR